MPTQRNGFSYPPLNFIKIRKDGEHRRCTECQEIVFDCTNDHVLVVDLDFLNEMKDNTDKDDPMYPVYQGINPDALPPTVCPGCKLQVGFRQII